MNSRSKPYFFSFDTKSKPDKLICHAVVFETIELDKEVSNDTTFTLLGADCGEDPRILQMLQSAWRFIEANKLRPKKQ